MKNSARSGVRKCATAAATLLLGMGVWLVFGGGSAPARAAVDAYLKIEGLDAGSKDPAHMNWIEVTRVVAGDLNGDAMADREMGSGMATGKTSDIGSQSSGAGAGKVSSGPSGQVSTSPMPSMVRESPSKASTGKTMVRESPTMPSREAGSGMATGRRMHKPLVIMKEMDKASPKLAEACASGKHFPSAEVDLRGKHFMLYDVLISSVQHSGSSEHPTESITLTYQKIEMK